MVTQSPANEEPAGFITLPSADQLFMCCACCCSKTSLYYKFPDCIGCTSLNECLCCKEATKCNLHGDCLVNIFDKIEMFNADAASDEVLVGKLLAGRRVGIGAGQIAMDDVFANLRILHKDKPHASRRNAGAQRKRGLG